MNRFIRQLATLFLFAPLVSQAASTLSQGMVVSENKIASQVGADILKAGGNAIDAAVAVGYALAVVNPCCGNIGGGGFMTIHLANGKTFFLNFREKAPLKASKNMFENRSGNDTIKGYLAVAVPGTVLGLDTALKRYGSMTRQQVMNPAIRIANEGYIVTPYEYKQFSQFTALFAQQPEVAAIFLKNGRPYQPGERLIQSNLAKSLSSIATKGPDAFYKGSIASTIVQASQQHGGILSMQDFATYNIKEYQPIHCTYHGYDIYSAPPPSSGGVTLCEMLNILEYFPLKKLGFRTIASVQPILESMRYGFIDRNSQLGDPDFIHNPLEKLLSKDYAKSISEKIKNTRFNPALGNSTEENELTDTTHYSVIDKQGNAVAVTYTLNGFFGAGIIAGNTGFFLNNEMDDFATHIGKPNKFGLVQQEANAIEAGKRPLSSMTPTIVMKDGQLFMVIGSPGGPRIITTVLHTLINVIDYGMSLQDAVNAPRFHYQDEPDLVDVEPLAFSFITSQRLKLLGYHLDPNHRWGAAEGILVDRKTGRVEGANDRRRPDGAAIAAE